MTPAARLQAAIELLDEIIAAAREGGAAADTLIARYFKARRYAGSADRRAVRELVYRAIRRSGERPPSGRAAMIGLGAEEPDLLALFGVGPHGPAAVAEGEVGTEASPLPPWLLAELDPLVDEEEQAALLERAPLDLRVNTLRSTREDALARLPNAEPTPFSPLGLRFADAVRIEDSELWQVGAVEVQDEASQLAALACAPAAGSNVLDLCAGAGGKTLALAALMKNCGHVLACDTDRRRLSRLAPRLERAGVSIVEHRLLDPDRERDQLADWRGRADLVLVDAPCSGSGTWRRNPETRWRLTAERLCRLESLQARLLRLAAELVRPGGHMAYAVCSVLAREGRQQAERLGRSSLVSVELPIAAGRSCGHGRLLTPGWDGTDGFFVARWQAAC